MRLTTKNEYPKTPESWGIFLSRLWGNNYPINAKQIAYEFSEKQKDPILKIVEHNVDGVLGVLRKSKKKMDGI